MYEILAILELGFATGQNVPIIIIYIFYVPVIIFYVKITEFYIVITGKRYMTQRLKKLYIIVCVNDPWQIQWYLLMVLKFNGNNGSENLVHTQN